jgi:hypothetical protein
MMGLLILAYKPALDKMSLPVELVHRADRNIAYNRQASQNVARPPSDTPYSILYIRVDNADHATDWPINLHSEYSEVKSVTLVSINTFSTTKDMRAITLKTQEGNPLFPQARVAADATITSTAIPLYQTNRNINLQLAHFKDCQGKIPTNFLVDQKNWDGTPVEDARVCLTLLLELAMWQ